jgi:hypothetical protein
MRTQLNSVLDTVLEGGKATLAALPRLASESLRFQTTTSRSTMFWAYRPRDLDSRRRAGIGSARLRSRP